MSEFTGTKSEEDAEKKRLRKHQVFNATPTQVDAWIDANVTDLASAKEALKLIAKVALFKP